jgi:uncharacterized protein (DUF58 family)
VNLTPLGLALVALIALAGILGQGTDWVGALSWRAAAALLVTGLFCEFLISRRTDLAVRFLGPDRLYLGRRERLAVELENRAERSLAVRFAPLLPAVLAGSRAPRSARLDRGASGVIALEARPTGLGASVWPALPVRIEGPFKLAWWSRRLELAASVRVVPDTLGGSTARVTSAQGGSTTAAVPGGARELHHLRAYRAGDPRHTIDWKATARASRLITRVYSEDQHLEVVILIDAGRTSRTVVDGLSQLSHYANLAARFAEYCVAGDDQVGLVAFAEAPLNALAPARGRAAVQRIRTALAALEPRPVESDVLSAALLTRRLVRHRCLALILTDLYERSAAGQLVQSARLLAPKHLPMIVGLMSEEVLQLAARSAEERLDPYQSLAAREYQRHVAANVSRLTRMGAQAMTARARELDAKVLGRYALLRAQRRI